MTLIPTTNRVKILLWSGFSLFHYGVIMIILGLMSYLNGIHDPILQVIFYVTPVFAIATCPTLAYSGWKYFIVKLTGKGEWIWSQRDLDKYNSLTSGESGQ